jgi:holo-[acyl-carrier protein] synthase
LDIYSVGTDIIEVRRIEEAIVNIQLFSSRVFTPREIEYCQKKGKNKYQSFAGRFAAKEAVAKSLGTGFGRQLSFTDVEILSHGGQPITAFSAKGIELINRLGISRVEVSISATREYAVAFSVSLTD